MPRRRRSEKGRRGALLLDSEHDDEMALQIGLVRDNSPEEMARLRAAYFEHRDELLSPGPVGTRPWGFYIFELGLDGVPAFARTDPAGFAMTSQEAEGLWLKQHGHLTRWEELVLEQQRVSSTEPVAAS